MEIRWSALAVDDLERIFARIKKDNPTAALETVQAIFRGCENAERLSPSWTPRTHWRTTGIGVSPLPYIAVYQVKEYAVEISRIYHGAQDWP